MHRDTYRCAVYLDNPPRPGSIYGLWFVLETQDEKRISITLSSDVLSQIDELAGSKRSLSLSDRLNIEVADVLKYVRASEQESKRH